MTALPSVTLGLYLAATGIGHFVAPRYFQALVPAWIPAPRFVVAGSGLVELVVAAALFVPTTRVVAAWFAAAMIMSFLVVWVDALRNSSNKAARVSERPIGIAIKIFVNFGYIGWAITAALIA